MSWVDWLLVSFAGALAAGLVVFVLNVLLDTRLRGIRSVTFEDGPLWRVTNGRQMAFIEAVGLKVKGSDGKSAVVQLRGQRPYARETPQDQGSRQGETIRLDPARTLYFGPTEDILGAFAREKVRVHTSVVHVRAFIRVQGRKRLRYARKWCDYDCAKREVIRPE